jgi:hypothetical protein
MLALILIQRKEILSPGETIETLLTPDRKTAETIPA